MYGKKDPYGNKVGYHLSYMETKITVPINKKSRIINHKLKLSSEFDPYTQIDRYTKNIGNQRYRRVFEKVTLC